MNGGRHVLPAIRALRFRAEGRPVVVVVTPLRPSSRNGEASMTKADTANSTHGAAPEPISTAILNLHDRLANVRHMVALATAAIMPVAENGDANAVAGLNWVMHLTQEKADGAINDLAAVRGRLRA